MDTGKFRTANGQETIMLWILQTTVMVTADQNCIRYDHMRSERVMVIRNNYEHGQLAEENCGQCKYSYDHPDHSCIKFFLCP